ncbi:MAG: peptidylprolyl isomerase [Candidatus Eisenbacteria bacterium]
MTGVREGDTVHVRYRGTLEDGTVFDSSGEKKPFEVRIGSGRVIPGFERALLGIKVGEKRKVEIPPEDAYGRPREDLCLRVDKAALGRGASFRVGQEVQIRREGERAILGRVKESGEDAIVVDANHPLAGKTLSFEIELLKIL